MHCSTCPAMQDIRAVLAKEPRFSLIRNDRVIMRYWWQPDALRLRSFRPDLSECLLFVLVNQVVSFAGKLTSWQANWDRKSTQIYISFTKYSDIFMSPLLATTQNCPLINGCLSLGMWIQINVNYSWKTGGLGISRAVLSTNASLSWTAAV